MSTNSNGIKRRDFLKYAALAGAGGRGLRRARPGPNAGAVVHPARGGGGRIDPQPHALRASRALHQAPQGDGSRRPRAGTGAAELPRVRRRHPVLVPGAGRSGRAPQGGGRRGRLGHAVPVSALPRRHGRDPDAVRRQSLGPVRDSASAYRRRPVGRDGARPRPLGELPGRRLRHPSRHAVHRALRRHRGRLRALARRFGDLRRVRRHGPRARDPLSVRRRGAAARRVAAAPGRVDDPP